MRIIWCSFSPLKTNLILYLQGLEAIRRIMFIVSHCNSKECSSAGIHYVWHNSFSGVHMLINTYCRYETVTPCRLLHVATLLDRFAFIFLRSNPNSVKCALDIIIPNKYIVLEWPGEHLRQEIKKMFALKKTALVSIL